MESPRCAARERERERERERDMGEGEWSGRGAHTWLVLGATPVVLAHRVEQLTAR